MYELVQDGISRILDDHATARGAAAETPEGAKALIGLLDGAGMLEVLAGWAGESPPIAWRDGAALFMLLGEKAPDGPVAEAILARALVAAAGGSEIAALTVSAAATAALSVDRSGATPTLTGALPAVPWSTIASAVAVPVLADGAWRIAVIERADAQVAAPADPRDEATRDSRAEPRGAWTLERAPARQWLDWPAALDARLPGAAMRAAQLAGAMRAVLALSLQYASDRVQFARPIARNQAIQHSLAVMAENAALSATAARLAWASAGPCDSTWRVACAKALASDLAGGVAAAGHAVHGAIGFTSEYALNRLTRRLWQWRSEDGGAAVWHTVVGDLAIAGPHATDGIGPGLWSRIVTETSVAV